MKKYLVPAIGVAAFIIGGIVTRAHALETLEVLERTFTKTPPAPPAPMMPPPS